MSATMFKAVVWKELRESLKWAAFVLLSMATVLAFAIPSVDDLLQGEGVDLDRIFNVLDTTTTIGGLLAGLLIGAAQTFVENRGDKWGFLAHRPIGRTTLFWGKATAGILLYAISTGLPVAATLFWIASPGYLPLPFDWGIALPAIANLLGGLVFYFAGFLTGMREARWYVSRALGIGAACCCLFLQGAFAATFWQAVAAGTAGLIIVGTAAWGTFVAGGQYGVQPRLGRIATGVSIGLGITLVGCLLVRTINLDRFYAGEYPREFGYTYYTVTADGMVVRVDRPNSQIVEVSDLSGHPLEGYLNSNGKPNIPRDGVLSARLTPGMYSPPSFRSTGKLFHPLRRGYGGNPLSWYYVQRLGLIAAYDGKSRRLIGWMGPDGFSPGEAKPRPFAGRLKSAKSVDGGPYLLVLEDAVYQVDLDKRRVDKVFQREPAEALVYADSSRLNSATLASPGEKVAVEVISVISTTRRVIIQLRDGTKLLEAPQDAKAIRHTTLRVIRALQAPGAPTFLWYQGLGLPGEESQLAEFNSAGTLVNSWTLPSTNYVLPGVWPVVAIQSAITPLIGQASLKIANPTLRANSPFLGLQFYGLHETVRWAVAILSSLISAAAVFLRGRRYAFPPVRLSTWMGIALLLGPLGFLLMLALVEWPAREACPACSRKRVVTRERCEHCGEPFAAPPRDGTEIFEPAN